MFVYEGVYIFYDDFTYCHSDRKTFIKWRVDGDRIWIQHKDSPEWLDVKPADEKAILGLYETYIAKLVVT